MQQFIKMRKQVNMTESTRLVLNKSIDLLHKLSNSKMSKEEVKKELSVLLSTYFVTLYPDNGRGIDAEKKLKLEHFLEQAYDISDQVESGKVPLYEAIMLMNKVVVSLKPDSEDIELSKPKPNNNPPEEDEEQKGEEELEEEEGQMEREMEKEEMKVFHNRVQERDRVRFRPISKEVDDTEPFEEDRHLPREKLEKLRPRQAQIQAPTEGEVTDLIGNVLQKQQALESSIAQLNQSLNRIGFELKKL